MILHEVLRRRMSLTQNGRKRKVLVLEGMLTALINQAMLGNVAALRQVVDLWDRWPMPWQEAVREDSAAIDELRRRLNLIAQRNGNSS